MHVFVNFQGTRKTLSPEILKAEDPDSPSADLVYTVLDQGEAKEKGYVERVQSPGVRADTFTQLEVDQGLIAYVHRGGEPGSNARLALQVRSKVSSLADVSVFDGQEQRHMILRVFHYFSCLAIYLL
jgi:chondroitin sulfate proteoglycan 4